MSDEQMKDTPESPMDDSDSKVPDNGWPKLAALFFFLLMVAGIGYAYYEHSESEKARANYSQMDSILNDAQAQIATLRAKVASMETSAQNAAPAKPAETTREAKPSQSGHAAKTVARRRAEDPRWKKMQAQLNDQEQQLTETRQDLDQARSDLAGQISQSHDELNGTIAKNHDELVSLEKRGERNFYEFNLSKSKQFQRVGPISLALRKANTKHLFCDINLIVDDKTLSKKHVSLYEPVQFFPSDYGQPLQIVIYQIDKDQARGYVSAPKYRQSELGAQQSSSNPAAATTPDAAQQVAAKNAELSRREGPQQ